MSKQRAKRPLADRFWEKVDVRSDEECWPWKAFRKDGGYGMFSANKRPALSHRVAFSLRNGEIPQGLEVMHSCDNPPCCNPGHLKLGTHKDNMADSRAKHRHAGARITHCPRGHEYTPENTYFNHTNGRMCKSCTDERSADRRARVAPERISL